MLLRPPQMGKLRLEPGRGRLEFLFLAADSLGESSKVTTAADAQGSSRVLTAGQVLLPAGRAPRGEGGRGGRGASLIHELLAEAQSRGKIGDPLQVLVGGFIKLSAAAGCKSDEYSRFRPGSNSLARAITQ